MTRVRCLLLATPLLSTLAIVLPAAPARAAPCNRVMEVAYAVTTGDVIVLEPDHFDIAYRGCVAFRNSTATPATVKVGARYTQTVQPFDTTTGREDFLGTTSGRLTVTATSGPSSASGSITVAAAPTPKPSRSGSSPRPSRSSSSAPRHTQSPSGGSGPPPTVGAEAPNGGQPTPPLPPPPTGSAVTPVSPGNPSVAPPGPVVTTTPSPAHTTVVAGPLEPPSGRGHGLPGAVAALALVGTGAALLRVFLAEPIHAVDSRENVVRPA